jgi:Holliday junction resolvase RusA-like endonuclease
MVIEAFLPVPQSKSQKWKRDALDGRIIPETKPDLDNILKNLTDCLQRMRFFSDDKQIAVLKASKRYGAPEQVGYNVSLREM